MTNIFDGEQQRILKKQNENSILLLTLKRLGSI